MLQKSIVLLIGWSFCSFSQAQLSLEDQISAVNNAQQEAEYRKDQMKFKAESDAKARAKAIAAQDAARRKDEERLKDKSRRR